MQDGLDLIHEEVRRRNEIKSSVCSVKQYVIVLIFITMSLFVTKVL